MDEITQTRLIVLGIVLAIVAHWLWTRALEKARQARFAALAQSFGRRPVPEGDSLWRFLVAIDGRTFEVRHQYISGATGAGWSAGWYLVTQTDLQGVSDLHSFEIRARTRRGQVIDPYDPDFEKHFTIRDSGYPPREGWLKQRVRAAIAHFYALDLRLDPLSVEEGRLVHRSHLSLKRFDGDILRKLLTQQAAVAASLERVL